MIKSKQIRRPQLVLVVDDQEINRDVLGVILEDDYEIIYAENGAQALEEIEANATRLSIVLLDLMMPVMDGFEVLRRVTADEQLRHIPVIVLTAEKSAELRALQMGAADFITKPFDVPEVITARVGRIIELSEGRQLISAAEHDRLTMLYSRNFFFEYANRLYHYSPGSAHGRRRDEHRAVPHHQRPQRAGLRRRRAAGHRQRDPRLPGRDRGHRQPLRGGPLRHLLRRAADYRALLDRFQKKVNGISPNVSIHLRMGVKPWQEGVEPVLLFDRARAACNMVRGDYQNPLMIYDEDMRLRELLNQRLLNDLRAAVEERQFRVYYQPKYDIQCDPPRLASAEALIRWKHPELGMISPGDFVPLFEGNGLISIVDNFVWQEAARQIADWKRRLDFRLPVSVNLSRADVFDPTLVDRLVAIIRENGLDFKDIKLEVTESAYTEKAKDLLDVVRRLRTLGFAIEMDDFGSGYSSLNMLSDMPIDVLEDGHEVHPQHRNQRHRPAAGEADPGHRQVPQAVRGGRGRGDRGPAGAA